MPKKIIKEACVETLEEAILAEKYGANRIELCSRLDLDGLTPSRDLIQSVVEKVNIPVKVMIRPREGAFIYHTLDVERMISDIGFCKVTGVRGVVFGFLSNDHVDMEICRKLAKAANPLEVTFHKAIDLTADPVSEIKKMKELKCIHSVLTSGKQPTAREGKDMLKEMLKYQDDNFKIIVAGRVTKDNLHELHDLIGAEEYHGRKIVGDLTSSEGRWQPA